MQLSPGEIHVWRYEVDPADYLPEKNKPILSAEENIRAAAFINEDDRVRYVTVHRFLRKVLARYIFVEPQSIEFKKGDFEKPHIANTNDIRFNLSYRDEFALLAISNSCEPGIDIERIRRIDDPEAFSRNYFSMQERDLIEKAESERMNLIFTFWTFKEAVIKALGIGFSRDLTEYDLSEFIDRPANFLAADENMMWTIQKLPAPVGYKAAIAVRGEGYEVKKFNYRSA